jgi:hypothetical protein
MWLRDCAGEAGCSATVPAEHFEVQGFVDPSVSRFAPHGFYAYWELPRGGGVRGLVELDVPTDAEPAAPLQRYHASYRELVDTQLSFEAGDVRGVLSLPGSAIDESNADCACEDAAFALRFTAPGPDAELGTGDDGVRELTLGRLSRSDERCARDLPELSTELGLRVASSACAEPGPPVPSSAQPVGDVPSGATSCGYGECNAAVVLADTGSDDGCGSSSSSERGDSGCGNDDTSSAGSGGCGDDGSSTSPNNAGGCGDDSASTSAHHSGDRGDDSSSTSSSGCEGDTSSQEHASCGVTRLPSRRRSRHGASFFGTGLPLVLSLLWHGLRSARLRAAARRGLRQARAR